MSLKTKSFFLSFFEVARLSINIYPVNSITDMTAIQTVMITQPLITSDFQRQTASLNTVTAHHRKAWLNHRYLLCDNSMQINVKQCPNSPKTKQHGNSTDLWLVAFIMTFWGSTIKDNMEIFTGYAIMHQAFWVIVKTQFEIFTTRLKFTK